jgi:uncharacterized membrane protein
MNSIILLIVAIVVICLAVWGENFLADVVPLPIVRLIQALTVLAGVVWIYQRLG